MGLSHHLAPRMDLSHPLAPRRAFHIVSLFFFLFLGGVLLLITRLLASPFSCCEILLQVVFFVPRQSNRLNLVTAPYVDVL